ncbi:translation initiation factor eIF-2B subunit delta-like [Schistocerca gregaria]|uniref:translation initiation factor eIF-2B subunit delta-like n=1 Tax=Schistocerca gregaria TaxID=7010 RepID=UPI00211F39A8|nr:translation initiation factor eIF-2B subunit delta-like [Schistocerca gregaria]
MECDQLYDALVSSSYGETVKRIVLTRFAKKEAGEDEEKGRKGERQQSGARKGNGGGPKSSKKPQYDYPKQRERAKKKQIISLEPSRKQVTLFSHLPQFERSSSTRISERIMLGGLNIPSVAISLGLKYASYQIQGANARCLAILEMFRNFVENYVQVTNKCFGMELEKVIEPTIQFIKDCRPYSIGMGNMIRHFKRKIGNTMSMSVEEAKRYLVEELDTLIRDRVVDAEKTAAKITSQKIYDGDVILTYCRSNAVLESLKEAARQGKRFRAIIVDSRPHYEGRTILEELSMLRIPCEYVLLNAISYVIKTATKVLIGAHALMNNGQVYSRVGTAIVCMMANANHIPVLVVCETYKFCELSQLDSICQNELGDPEELVSSSNPPSSNPLHFWRENPNLKLLNLVYDLTPTEFISMVISEVGAVPPTSVPVIIREFYSIT